jgi:hypothetical protein
MRLFVNIETNRVVWFTNGNEEIAPQEATAVVDFQGEMPKQITTLNCWNYALRDRKLTKLEPTPTATLIETNRQAAHDTLIRRTNNKRKKLANALTFCEMVSLKKLAAAEHYQKTGESAQILARLAAVWGIGMTEAAQRIIDEHTDLERKLLTTEADYVEMAEKINRASTADQLRIIHEQLLSR